MKSPFKFLDSYTREDKELFFGRGQEIETLYTKVFQSKILLVYGASGTGKTSLIQCGLANKFQNSDWLPVFIRRGTDINHSFKEKIREVTFSPINEKTPIKKAIQSLYLDHFKPVFFIFDQFEELFIFGTKEEQTEFVIQLAEIINSELNCRFIFSIREEYIAVLNYFEEFIPEFFDNRTRIEKMTRKNAVEAIVGPCRYAGIKLDENFPDQLLEKLSPEGKVIELTYLQVYLDRMYRKTIENQKTENIIFPSKLLDEMGRVGDVLSEFLDEQIELMKNPELCTSILKTFVSMEGTKRQVSLNEILETSKVLGKELEPVTTEETIHKLVDIRILREKDEQGKYELRHDALAQRIFEKITMVEKELMEVRVFLENAFKGYEKRKTLLREEDLKYIYPYEGKLFINEQLAIFVGDSRKAILKNKRKKRRIEIMTVISIFVVMGAFTWWALQERKKSELISKIAQSDRLAAFAQLNLEKDPTLSYRLAEKGYNIYPGELSKKVINASFMKGPFYNQVAGKCIAVNSKDKLIYTIENDSIVNIFNFSGALQSKRNLKFKIFSYSFSKDYEEILFGSKHEEIFVLDKKLNLLKKVNINISNRKESDFIFSSKFNPVIAKISNNKKYVFAITEYNIVLFDFPSFNKILSREFSNPIVMNGFALHFMDEFCIFSENDDFLLFNGICMATTHSGESVSMKHMIWDLRTFIEIDSFITREWYLNYSNTILKNNYIVYSVDSITYTYNPKENKKQRVEGIFVGNSGNNEMFFTYKQNKIYFYNINGSKISELPIFAGDYIEKFYSNDDGNKIILLNWSGKLMIIEKLKYIREIKIENFKNNFHLENNFKSSNDEKFLSYSCGNYANICKANGKEIYRIYEDELLDMTIMSFFEIGNIIISTTNDHTRIWNYYFNQTAYTRIWNYYLSDINNILKRVNKEKIFGEFRQLTPEEKKEYGIEE